MRRSAIGSTAKGVDGSNSTGGCTDLSSAACRVGISPLVPLACASGTGSVLARAPRRRTGGTRSPLRGGPPRPRELAWGEPLPGLVGGAGHADSPVDVRGGAEVVLHVGPLGRRQP